MKQNDPSCVLPKETRVQYNRKNKTFLFFSEIDYSCSKSIIERIRAKRSLNKQPISPFQLIAIDNALSLTLKGLTTKDEKKILELFVFHGLNPQIIEEKSNIFLSFSWIKSFRNTRDLSSEEQDNLNLERTTLLPKSSPKL